MEQAMIRGLGEGRERGYGALRLHLGIAKDVIKGEREIRKAQSKLKSVMLKAIEIRKRHKLPSASQIGALLSLYRSSGEEAAFSFLRQQKDRGPRYWSSWQDIYTDLADLLGEKEADSGLQYLANQAVADRKDEA
jgi:hypothetical protein